MAQGLQREGRSDRQGAGGVQPRVLGPLKERGLKHPHERRVLSQIAQAYVAVVNEVTNFLKTAITWLIQKIEWIWDRIKEAAGWVWDKLKAAAKAVAHFFGL
ncbi:hypothetical protein GCM10027174_40070 [Salinifilum aidingensis]